MKKLLLAFDADHFSEGAFEFARRLNELQPVLLTGIFLPLYNHVKLWNYTDGLSGYNFVPMEAEKGTEIVHQNIKQFKTLCQKNGIAYKVHKDFYDFALPELRKETRFSDVLIISSEIFYRNRTKEDPGQYLQETLHAAESAVIVTPENFEFPERNVIAYDGSGASIFAMKQFAYLFPELCSNETLLVYTTDNENQIPDEPYVEELAAQHFKNLTFLRLEANPGNYFGLWASEEKAAIIICGSYGRSTLSERFRKSFITDVIAAHQLPVFIAHP